MTDVPAFAPHRRQLLVGPEPVEAAPGWRTQRLGPTTWLSHCAALPVTTVRDLDGCRWSLCGRALEVDPRRLAPTIALTAARTGDVATATWGWAGRWVLVAERALHLDASGQLGCLVGVDGDRRPWLSSSPALLAERCRLAPPPAGDRRPLAHGRGISWRPPPRTGLDGVVRVLPSQVVDPATGTVAPRPWLPPVATTVDVDAVADAVWANLAGALRGLANGAGPPWLGLSAGYDSRLVLAVAAVSGTNVRPFTRRAPRMSLADRLLPPRIAAAAGCPHDFLSAQRRRAERWPAVDHHAAAHVALGDAEPLLSGARASLDGVAVGGHGFELANGFGRISGLPPAAPDRATAAAWLARAMGEPEGSPVATLLEEWLAWADRARHEGLDWRDRFFLEQREAGWQSAKEQVYDLDRVERVPLLNAAVNISLVLGVPEDERRGSRLQVRLLERYAPHLLAIPANPPDRSFGHVRASALRLRTDPKGSVLRAARAVRRRVWP